ncbi:MAG: TolC family protein [Prevotellaceae bacterium]|jgi:outer membrane protein TolC|nr:TolC family protein [Prevotellaceae bacterium]
MKSLNNGILKSLNLLIFILLFATVANGQLSLTIEKAMDIAQKNSPALRTSQMNLERYKQMLIAQQASLKSQFSLNVSPVNYSRSRQFDTRFSEWYTNENLTSGGEFQVAQPILRTDGVVSLINSFAWQTSSSDINGVKNNNDAFTNNLYLRISQPVFTYNRRKMELKQLEFNFENANISYALQRLETERQITSQFYSVYTAQSNLKISKEELENVQQSYDIIKNKVEADLAAKDELFQAELNLATTRSSVDASKVRLENAKDQLKRTLGLPLSEDLNADTEVDIKIVNIDLDKAIEYGLNTRLELRQREISGEELNFELIRTKAMNEFKGDVSLSFGLLGDNSNFGKIYDNPTQNPRVAITFAIPIFDWGEKKARIKAQKMSQEVHDLNKEEDKIGIELNIRQVWRNLENLRTQISIAEQSVRNAQLTYDLNLTRYREGDITGMDISQFQTQLSSKKMSYTQSLIDYKIELLNLKILSLFDFEKNVPIAPMSGL